MDGSRRYRKPVREKLGDPFVESRGQVGKVPANYSELVESGESA